MNKETAKGTFNDAAGRAKRQIGEWTNDPEKQVEGAAQQIKGKAQKVVGQVKDAAKDAANESKNDNYPNSGRPDQHTEERNRKPAH